MNIEELRALSFLLLLPYQLPNRRWIKNKKLTIALSLGSWLVCSSSLSNMTEDYSTNWIGSTHMSALNLVRLRYTETLAGLGVPS
jgi:hypothetical protein